jgi:hypothetical protein
MNIDRRAGEVERKQSYERWKGDGLLHDVIASRWKVPQRHSGVVMKRGIGIQSALSKALSAFRKCQIGLLNKPFLFAKRRAK